MNGRVSAITAMLLLGCTTAAFADPITISITDFRTTPVLALVNDANGRDRHSSVPGQGDVMTATVSATTGTSSGAATATLLSSFSDPLHMSGTGTASVAYD